MYPASSFQEGRLIMMQLQASINSLKASGVQIKLQVEESVENLQVLMKHLQERSREGTLRSDRDTYALLHNIGSEPGNNSKLFVRFLIQRNTVSSKLFQSQRRKSNAVSL